MPRNVLIVDSDTSSWQSIGAILGDKEYSIDYSDVYSDAWEKVQTQSFELIIVDMGWPKLEGMSVLSKLSQKQPEATIIAVSEFTDREVEQDALRNGADSCLTKPVNEADLLQAIISAKSASRHHQDLDSVTVKNVEQTLLRGFTPDQQWDFRMIGRVRNYQLGDVIPLDDDNGSMIWVEQGKLLLYHNNVAVESLGEGEFWGEDAFVSSNSLIIYVVAQDAVQLRHFSRKSLIEFFSYQDETLTKRYMINLINCLHLKWNRTITRLVMAILPAISKASEEAHVPEL